VTDRLRPFWSAFQTLSRDRQREIHPLGMDGSVPLSCVIPVPRIRDEAKWLGFEGDAFDDFVVIVQRIDDEFVAVQRARELEEAVERSKQTGKRRG
jgi:hypothetical protein